MCGVPDKIGIADCKIVPVKANPDERGCLFELYRQSWPGAIPTVQWNACISEAGVLRGVHVHVDYHEFYTMPRGRGVLGLSDIRRNSPTFGKSVQFEWADSDACGIVVPQGVAHVMLFEEPTVLAFGLSGYWKAEYDNVGCQFDAPELGFAWSTLAPRRSERDLNSGTYQSMLETYEQRAREFAAAGGVVAPLRI